MLDMTERERIALTLTRGMSAHAVEWIGDGPINDRECAIYADAVRFVGDRKRGTTLEAWATQVVDACKTGDPAMEWWAWLNETIGIRDAVLVRQQKTLDTSDKVRK